MEMMSPNTRVSECWRAKIRAGSDMERPVQRQPAGGDTGPSIRVITLGRKTQGSSLQSESILVIV